eukprot:07232.XXX_323165_321805_1 [CDS] Oithona nana genome sequencing.
MDGAQILVNENVNYGDREAPKRLTDESYIDRFFSFKQYEPSKVKQVLLGGGLIFLVLLLTIILVSTTSSRHIFEPYGGRIEVSGTYRLHNYDKKFDDYLLSLDIPRHAIGMIRASKEMITVTEPSHGNPNWTLTMRTEYFIHEVTFRMNEEFHVPWDRSSQIRHFCTLPAYNEIDCTTTAPTKGWNLRTRMIFTSQGLIDEKTNLDKNIATNKTYTRLKDDQNETIDDDENGIFNPDIDHEGSPFPEEN